MLEMELIPYLGVKPVDFKTKGIRPSAAALDVFVQALEI
jgi:hypothetical protein